MNKSLWHIWICFCQAHAFLSEFTRYNRKTSYVLPATERYDNREDLWESLDETFEYPERLEYRKDFRCGFVSILGAANMGKSTLLNALLREELVIANSRPQTTRHAILGLLTTEKAQVCLVDTPGIIETPAYKLQEGMMEAVVGALQDADVLLVVTDVFSTPIPDDSLFGRVQRSDKPVIVVINKIDLANHVKSATEKSSSSSESTKISWTPEQATAYWRQLLPRAFAILPVCASRGPDDPGVQALRSILTGEPDIPAKLRNLGRPIPGMLTEGLLQATINDSTIPPLLPLSPPLYDTDVLTDRTERFVASELIRVALFESLKKELPYCCEVQIQEFKEPRGHEIMIRIVADVIVERDSQKIIVVGKNGEQIKKIGVLARKKLEDFLQSKVSRRFLFC
jgi:GTP-binding protein Era